MSDTLPRTRIYRRSRTWAVDRYDSSGRLLRDHYPTGQAALIALDPRNRPAPPPPPVNPLALLGETFIAMLAAPWYIVQDAIKPGTGKTAFRAAFPRLTKETR